MKLNLIYNLMKLKAEKSMKNGDISGYLKALSRMNELKVSLATA